MKRKLSRCLTSTLCVLALLLGLSSAAFAEAPNACGKNVTCSFSDGTLTIEGTGPMYSYWGTPESRPWESYREQIYTVIVGDGVTKIGGDVFWYCSNLTSVTIPSSVTSLDEAAFIGCSSLTDVYFKGSESQWDNAIGTYGVVDNAPLRGVTIHFDSTGSTGTSQPANPTTPAAPTTPVTPTAPTTPATPSTSTAQAAKAVWSRQSLKVDDKYVNCEKYNISGANYFKLRDLAHFLNGTGSQFDVGFDEAAATVRVTTGVAYASDTAALTVGPDKSGIVQPSHQTIRIDGTAYSDLTAYNIGGNNYFQLRELGTVLGFDVKYDADSDTAFIYSRRSASDTPARLDTSNFSAEYMGSKYYQNLQNVSLTGDYRTDIIAVAESQIGYHEGSNEKQLDGSYSGNGDYSEYGRYLGSMGTAWCSEFASWCARMAEVPASILANSRAASVKTFAAPYYTWDQTVFAGGNYLPQAGDLVLFAWTGTSLDAQYLSHTAIVHSVRQDGDTVTLTVVHGNSGGCVKKSDYVVNCSNGKVSKGQIGYFVAPNY